MGVTSEITRRQNLTANSMILWILDTCHSTLFSQYSLRRRCGGDVFKCIQLAWVLQLSALIGCGFLLQREVSCYVFLNEVFKNYELRCLGD